MADENRIPSDVAAAIDECWPDGVVAEFDTEESYFCDIQEALERDLGRIPGASPMWQTEAEEDWQSYRVFFLAAQGEEFEFEAETEGPETEDPEQDARMTTYPGRGWYGCAVGVSLAAPFAVVHLGEFAEFEDGTASAPDIEAYTYSEQTGERVEIDVTYRDALGEDLFRKLGNLRQRTTAVLAKHGIRTLDPSILDLPVSDLMPDEEVFLEAPLSLRDAFFFRGV
jgi:hypothetical protein